MRRPSALLASLAALAGCGLTTVPGARILKPRPVAAFAASDLDEGEGDAVDAGPAEEFPPGWAMRVSLTTYFGENTHDVAPRIVLGGYYHFKETDVSRFEAAVELAPDLSDLGDNRYFVFGGRYMRFVGDAGSFFWKAGGGAILEMRGDETDFFGLVEAGGGAWIELGEKKALVLGAALQMPLGRGVNAPVILALGIGIELF